MWESVWKVFIYLFIYFISFYYILFYLLHVMSSHTTSSSNRYVSLIVFVTCCSDIVHTQKHAVDVCKYWISKYTLFQSWKWINETEMFLLFTPQISHFVPSQKQRSDFTLLDKNKAKWSSEKKWPRDISHQIGDLLFFLIWAFHHSQNTYQII